MELKNNMKFYQKEDGSCDLIFSEEELKIINKHKKLRFTALTFRHFGNIIVEMVARFQLNFNDEIAKTVTSHHEKIEGISPEKQNDTYRK